MLKTFERQVFESLNTIWAKLTRIGWYNHLKSLQTATQEMLAATVTSSSEDALALDAIKLVITPQGRGA